MAKVIYLGFILCKYSAVEYELSNSDRTVRTFGYMHIFKKPLHICLELYSFSEGLSHAPV